MACVVLTYDRTQQAAADGRWIRSVGGCGISLLGVAILFSPFVARMKRFNAYKLVFTLGCNVTFFVCLEGRA